MLARVGWDALRADVTRRRAAGETVGLGLAYFLEKSGQGPVEGVRLTVDVTGTVELVTGAALSTTTVRSVEEPVLPAVSVAFALKTYVPSLSEVPV